KQSVERLHAVAVDKDHAGDPNPWKKQPVNSTLFLPVLKVVKIGTILNGAIDTECFVSCRSSIAFRYLLPFLHRR
ncbi:hypothetical protein, partial [Burkholderia metallica]|uniref:hypothetical protein n=1 Tax=Burkholderia metallica TaxID=488729 RepID=UPI001C2D83C8